MLGLFIETGWAVKELPGWSRMQVMLSIFVDMCTVLTRGINVSCRVFVTCSKPQFPLQFNTNFSLWVTEALGTENGHPGYEHDGEEIQRLKVNGTLAMLFVTDPWRNDMW